MVSCSCCGSGFKVDPDWRRYLCKLCVCAAARNAAYSHRCLLATRLKCESPVMEYQVVIGRDRAAGVWFVRTTNIPGLALEDPSLDNLLEKLPAAISWVLHDPKTQKKAEEVPYEYLVVDREMARAAG